MKKCLLSLFISLNIFCYSQWNNGNISLAQVRSGIEFIDSNHILVAGGQVWFSATNNSIASLAHLYDVTTKQSTILTMNTPRLEPTLVRGDSGIYIIGGISNGGDVNGNGIYIENTMEIYRDGNFNQVNMPFRTYEAQAIALNGKIIVAGGPKYWKWYQNAADVMGETDLWIYDEASMTWSSRPSTDNRFYSSAVTDGNIAIFAGGIVMNNNMPSSILDGFSLSNAYEIYDSQNDTWTTGTLSAGGARAKISACHCNGYFVFAGGSVDNNIGSSRIDIYDGNSWTNQNMVQYGSSNSRAIEDCATAGDKILFAGGLDHNLTNFYGGTNIYDRVDIFDSQTQTFSLDFLLRPSMDFRMAGYGRRAAVSPSVGSLSTPWQWTPFNEIQVYEDASWINSVNESLKNNISLYPNPTKENITISTKNYSGNIKTEVYNLIGNKLLISNDNTISLRDYAKGIYLLKVSYGDRVEEVKVIKE